MTILLIACGVSVALTIWALCSVAAPTPLELVKSDEEQIEYLKRVR